MKSTFILLLLLYAGLSRAQVWQWAIPVRHATEGNGKATAYLWIPPNCRQLRGVVIAQNNMEEQSILESETFRSSMAKEGFAEIWVSPPFDHLFRFDAGAGEVFNGMMNDLANVSGYTELTYAPVVPIGHSAAASWPYYFAVWNAGRTLCAISTSGQWPYFRDKTFAPDIWNNKTLDYVPLLETMGEYEAADTWSAEGLKERGQHPYMPLSMLACPAEGHFAATAKKINYIALYIHKAIHYRLKKDCTQNSFAALIPIDPTRTGWLAEKWRINQTPANLPAPVGKYTGDATQAFWFFDEEMAEATQQYQSAYRNMQAPLLGYVQDGKIVPQHNNHQQVDLKFEPLDDGLTFHLHATFLDTVPGAHKRTAEWTGLPAGSPVGKPQTHIPVKISRIAGPFIKLDDTTFRLQLKHDDNAEATELELWFAATHPGNNKYKPAVQQARMIVPVPNRDGKKQHIRFPKINIQGTGIKAIPLNAVSDAGLPVGYYVKQGPAYIEGNIVKLTNIPPRSKYPVKVTVVAWQYGIPGKVQRAANVEQSFFIGSDQHP